MNKIYYVYILASGKNGTLYIGTTSNILKRTSNHQDNAVESFTKKYDVHKLVYFEEFSDPLSAITREKQMKKWKREWKIKLIEKDNSNWDDLSKDLF